MLASNDALSRKLAELERRLEKHDQGIKTLFEAIRELMAPPARPCDEPSDNAIWKFIMGNQSKPLCQFKAPVFSDHGNRCDRFHHFPNKRAR